MLRNRQLFFKSSDTYPSCHYSMTVQVFNKSLESKVSSEALHELLNSAATGRG